MVHKIQNDQYFLHLLYEILYRSIAEEIICGHER